jgi:pimeloyl-ACP methyl ester carboxylesterase
VASLADVPLGDIAPPSGARLGDQRRWTRIAWYRYGEGERAILFVPTWNIVDARVDWDRPARLLGAVACPTLVVHGDSDAAVPVSLVRGIVAAMPTARLELIPGGGHRPDIRSPEIVNPLLLELLLDA